MERNIVSIMYRNTPKLICVFGLVTATFLNSQSQNVGIGTASPISKLHVNGDVRIGLVNPIGFANSGNNYGDLLHFGGGPGFTIYDSDNSDPFWIGRYNVVQDISELRICVGDNYNTPFNEADELSIGGMLPGGNPNTFEGYFEFTPSSPNGYNAPMLSIGSRVGGHDKQYNGGLTITKDPNDCGQAINLVRAGMWVWSMGYVFNSSNFAIGTGVTNNSAFTNPQFVMTPLGQVGLGVANPGYRLQLPNINSPMGQGCANAWTCTSDARFKTNLAPISGSLEGILSLKPVKYNWLENHISTSGELVSTAEVLAGTEIGFLAQELYEVFPEVVKKPEDESRQYWTVDYPKLTVVLCRAIQEQQSQIDKLSKTIEAMLPGSESLGAGRADEP